MLALSISNQSAAGLDTEKLRNSKRNFYKYFFHASAAVAFMTILFVNSNF